MIQGDLSSFLTAYAVLCGPTASPGPVQPIASVGSAGQVLTSNGAEALPTMQDAQGWQEIEALTFSAAASVTSSVTIAKNKFYKVTFHLIQNTSAGNLYCRFNADSGNNYAWANFVASNAPAHDGAGGAATNLIGLTGYATCKVGSFHSGEFNFSAHDSDGTIVQVTGNSMFQRSSDDVLLGGFIWGYYNGGSNLSSITIGTSAGTVTGTASIQELK